MEDPPGTVRRFRINPATMKKMMVIILVVGIALLAAFYFMYQRPNEQAMDFLKKHNINVTAIFSVDKAWGEAIGVTNSDWWDVVYGYTPPDEPWNSTTTGIWINLKTGQYHISYTVNDLVIP